MEKVLHAQMPFTTGGQTINDRLTAAYHSLAGSQLGKTVCKATTEETMGPKKKHLDYLLHCTHEPNVSIPQLANLMIERTTNTNWCVVFKSLITIHNLMCYGNERFSQYLASSNANFNLGNFLDKTSVQGYDMSTHVRRYGKYISEKIYTYRMMAFDFCKVKRGREDGLLRTMPTEKLLKTLPLLQSQVDALLEFQVQAQELTNGVINSCFILLFRDLIRLFACYNDGIINLLEKYFDMNKKQCREALDLYKNFLMRMDKVAEFLKVAEAVGIDRGEIPDLAKAPSSLMDALEQHLNALEGGKISGGGSRVTSPATVSATRSAIENLSTFHEPGYVDTSTMDEATKRKLLEEEQERLNTLKEQRLREIEFNQAQRDSSQPKTNPFLPSPSAAAPSSAHSQSKASDDLLSLDFGSPQAPQAPTNPFAAPSGIGSGLGLGAQPSPQQPLGAGSWGSSSVGFPPMAAATNGHQQPAGITANGLSTSGFASDETFAKAFGGPSPQVASSGFLGGGGELQPTPGPPSRGITPTPEEIGAPGFNPFLSGDAAGVGADAPSWTSPAHTGATSTGGDSGFGDASSDIGQRAMGMAAAACLNPFEAFQQNADGISALSTAAETSSALGDQTPPAFASVYDSTQDAGQPAVPLSSGYGSSLFCTTTTPTLGVENLDAVARAQLIGRTQPASGRSSALGSPAVVASPVHAAQQQPMASSSPMPIPGAGGGLNIYQHTPFSNMDASYTSSPQFPRHMQAAPMAGSYSGASTAFGGSSGQQTPARPPSAPAAEMGLDPFGDMLTPMPSVGGGAQPQQAAGASSQQAPTPQQKKTDGKIVKGDLDSSLASLAQNLNIGKGQDVLKNKPVQWGGSAKGQQPTSAASAPVGAAPMGAPMWGAAPAMGVPGTWGAAPGYPQAAPGVWGAPAPGMMPGMAPMGGYGQARPMYGGPPTSVMGMGGMQPSGMYGQQPQRMANPQDPFGAL